MLKRFVLALALTLALSATMSVPVSACSYSRVSTGSITAVCGNTVEVVTRDGNVWSFFGDKYEVGDKVLFGFDTHNTTDRTDDELVMCSVVGHSRNAART